MGNKHPNVPSLPFCLTYDVQMKIVIDQIYIDFQIELYRSNVFQKCSYIFTDFSIVSSKLNLFTAIVSKAI